eukprot:TRINITY_DN50569_c0_g1_i1.p1 TRINITY_DN50569_c0_g1~~TRINITY_DN50569_c0_g1_i1.p1  ORF type:complete len:276 (-),score=60.01 TRINITY_DN50569_c0_g1_i1:2-829(-)
MAVSAAASLAVPSPLRLPRCADLPCHSTWRPPSSPWRVLTGMLLPVACARCWRRSVSSRARRAPPQRRRTARPALMWYDDLESLAEVTDRVFLQVSAEASGEGRTIVDNYVTGAEKEVSNEMDAFEGRIVLGLYGSVAPKAVENFTALCRGESGLTYRSSPIHRVFWDFMIQGGDIENGDGSGGKSIYGETFDDDEEGLLLSHGRPGLLGMANSGPNTNTSQFYITTAKAEFLDGEHVIFGEVIEGRDVVMRVEQCASQSGDPLQRVVITDCGQL